MRKSALFRIPEELILVEDGVTHLVLPTSENETIKEGYRILCQGLEGQGLNGYEAESLVEQLMGTVQQALAIAVLKNKLQFKEIRFD